LGRFRPIAACERAPDEQHGCLRVSSRLSFEHHRAQVLLEVVDVCRLGKADRHRAGPLIRGADLTQALIIGTLAAPSRPD